ncbi:MAG: LysM peptidoglycan-binding domain-containing protein [Fusobacteriota bacterium]
MVKKIIKYYDKGNDFRLVDNDDQEAKTGKKVAPNTISIDKEKEIDKLANLYTNTYNSMQKEQQNKALQAFGALADFGLTAVDAYLSAKELNMEDMKYDDAVKRLEDSKRFPITKPFKGPKPSMFSPIVENGVENGFKTVGSIFEANTDDKDENFGKVIGDINKNVRKLNNLKKLPEFIYEHKEVLKKTGSNLEAMKGSVKQMGKEITEQLGNYFAIWAPAIWAVKGRKPYCYVEEETYQGIDDRRYMHLEGTEVQIGDCKKFIEEVEKEVKYNRVAAQIMGVLMELGFIGILAPEPITSVIGVILIAAAQPVSNAIKEILINEEKGLKDLIPEIIDQIISFFDPTRFIGESRMFMKIEDNNKNFIQEMEVDSPGAVIGGTQSFLKGIKERLREAIFQIDQTFVSGVFGIKTEDQIKYYGGMMESELNVQTEFKGIKRIYADLPTIADYVKEEEDIDYIGFLKIGEGQDIMEKILKSLFDENGDGKLDVIYSMKEVEYKNSVPRLIHYLDKKNMNQVIMYSYKGYHEESPKKYLKHFKEHFEEEYIRDLLKQGIEIGKGWDKINNDIYIVQDISELNNDAKRIGLDLNRQDIKYYEILNLEFNKFFVEDKLLGKLFDDSEYKYDYILRKDHMFSKSDDHYFFKPNEDTIYGSLSLKEEERGSRLDYKFTAGFGTDKVFKNSNGMGQILLNNLVIGKNVKSLKKIHNERQNENYWVSTETHNNWIEERMFSNRMGNRCEIYRERIIEDNSSLLSISYHYYIAAKRLEIFYGPYYKEKNKLVIDDFRPGDYGLKLPRSHKLFGSIGKDIIDMNYVTLEEDPNDLICLDNKNGGKKITLVVDNKDVILGENIEKLDKVIKEEDTIYKYKQVSDEGWFDLADEIFFDYYLEDNELEIYYGKLYDGIPKYGNKIRIEDFKNGDYGIDLSIDYPILYGSLIGMDREPIEKYNFTGMEASHFVESNHEGEMVLNNMYLSEADIRNTDPEINELDRYINKITTHYMEDNFKNIYIYDSQKDDLTILYKSDLDKTVTVEVGDEEVELTGYNKVYIAEFTKGDYGIDIPVEKTVLVGSRYCNIRTVEKGDTLWDIAKEELGDGNLWRVLEGKGAKNFTTRTAKRIKPGEKIYIPAGY